MENSSIKPNVAKAGGIMMASIFLSRILGIGRDTIMVSLFGRDAMTDAYRLAFQVPDLFFYLLASGALSSAFIPVFSEYFHTGKKEEAWKVFSVVVTIMSTVLIGLLGFAWVFAEPLVHLVAPGKSSTLIPLIVQMSRILIPAQFAFLIGGLMFATLYARQQFIAPGLSPNIYNIGIILGALVLSHFVVPGIVGLTWGALIGAILGNLIIPFWIMKRMGSSFKPSLELRHPGVRKVFKLMLPVVLGLSLPALYHIIMQGIGSFYPDGVNTSLDLSNKLMQAPLGIFGQSLALAAFPALAQFFAQGRLDLYGDQLSRTLRTILYITLPVSLIMYILAPDIVAAALQYGKFNARDTEDVAACLQMFSLGIAAWCLQPVLMRAYYAIQNTIKPVLFGTLTTGIFAALALTLRHSTLSYLALPLACSVAAMILVVMMLFSLCRDIGNINIPEILTTFLKSSLACVGAGAFLLAGNMFFPTGEGGARNAWAFIRLGTLGLGSIWIYYGLTFWLKMPETKTLQRVFAKLSLHKNPSVSSKTEGKLSPS